MTLVAPIQVEPPEQVGPIHFIAIGGAGMSGIARLFSELGVEVSGSDQADTETLRSLADAGITTYVGHDSAQLGHARTVVVSTAVKESNPELAAARAAGLRIWHRSAALASLMLGTVGVSVAGTHGKTTTSAMTAVMLAAAGADPSYVIGSPLANTGRSAHLGSGQVFVVEADESDGSFRQYPTQIAVVTNIEADHLDNWLTEEAYGAGFLEFASGPDVRVVVVDRDDPGCQRLVAGLVGRDVKIVTVGEGPGADVRIVNPDYVGTSSHARFEHDGRSTAIQLRVPGRYNLHNAAAAFAVGLELGCDPQALAEGAGGFAGTERRFQIVGTAAGVTIVDDYAHHPTEVAAALTAARRVAGDGRVVACFQPHLFSRTLTFADAFGTALGLADVVVLTDIYPAREEPIPGVTSRLLEPAAAAAGAEVHVVPVLGDVAAALATLARPGDLVLTIGAGSITTVGPDLRRLLEATGGS